MCARAHTHTHTHTHTLLQTGQVSALCGHHSNGRHSTPHAQSRWPTQGTSMATGDIDGYRGHRWPTQGTSIVTHLHEWHFPLVGFVRLPTELGNQPTAEQQREGEGEWGGKVRHAYTTCTDLPPPAVSHLMRYAPSLSASAKVPAGKASPTTACIQSRAWASRSGSYLACT